jgi:branched-chain amino acid transport system permease protein
VTTSRYAKTFAALALAVLVLGLPAIAPGQPIHYAVIALNGILWTLGLNFFFGYCGQINFGAAAFAAMGGYGYALLLVRARIPALPSFVLAIAGAVVATYAVSLILLRLRGLVLGLGTLALAVTLHTTARTGLISLTNGEDGISLPILVVFGASAGDGFYYYLHVFLVVVGWYLAYAVLHSRIGRAFRAVAEDEAAATANGIDVQRTIRLALLLNAVFGAVAGAAYVQWVAWASPEHFGMTSNVLVLLALVVGGIGRPSGAVLGAVLMYVLPQVLIVLDKYQHVIYGLVLLLMLRFAPRGVVGVLDSLRARVAIGRAPQPGTVAVSDGEKGRVPHGVA